MTLELEEGERQALLMALAHLSVERPGWDDMLNRIAVRIDNVGDGLDYWGRPVCGRALMYDGFRALRKRVGP